MKNILAIVGLAALVAGCNYQDPCVNNPNCQQGYGPQVVYHSPVIVHHYGYGYGYHSPSVLHVYHSPTVVYHAPSYRSYSAPRSFSSRSSSFHR